MNTNLNIRLFVIECIKARRSGFYPIVVGAPLIIFLCYILYFLLYINLYNRGLLLLCDNINYNFSHYI